MFKRRSFNCYTLGTPNLTEHVGILCVSLIPDLLGWMARTLQKVRHNRNAHQPITLLSAAAAARDSSHNTRLCVPSSDATAWSMKKTNFCTNCAYTLQDGRTVISAQAILTLERNFCPNQLRACSEPRHSARPSSGSASRRRNWARQCPLKFFKILTCI